MLTAAALALLAFVAGLVGTWSPCGLSATETVVAPEAGGGRTRGRVGGVAAFATGCLAGGAATFGALGLVGWALPSAGRWAAVAVLAAAALADLAGLPVVPRIARQVPEPWRRRIPLAGAMLAYGALLGLGLTTYVMSYALWAALGATLLVGSPALALWAGLAFGAGRALPVIVLALGWERDWAQDLLDRMLLDGSALRRARRVAAVCGLLAAATLLPVADRADAAVIRDAYAVSGQGETIVVSGPDGATLRTPGAPPEVLPGTDGALGGGALAWREGSDVVVVDLATRAERGRLAVPGVDALAVEGDLLVSRATRGGRARIGVARIGSGEEPTTVMSGPAGSLSRPSISGGVVVAGRADARGSRIVALSLASGRGRVVRRAPTGTQIVGPSILGGRLLAWVEVDRCRQRARVGPIGVRAARTIRSWPSPVTRDPGFAPGYPNAFNRASKCDGGAGGGSSIRLGAVTLTSSRAYLTISDRSGGRPRIVTFLR